MKVFVDTGAFCALTIPKDRHNLTAKSVYKKIQKDKAVIYTSDYVLDETYTLLKTRSSHATAIKFEVDLIIQIKNRLYPVEIKLTATPTLKHLEPLNRFKAIAGDDASKEGLLVCRVNKITAMPKNNTAIPWRDFPEWLQSKLST